MSFLRNLINTHYIQYPSLIFLYSIHSYSELYPSAPSLQSCILIYYLDYILFPFLRNSVFIDTLDSVILTFCNPFFIHILDGILFSPSLFFNPFFIYILDNVLPSLLFNPFFIYIFDVFLFKYSFLKSYIGS